MRVNVEVAYATPVKPELDFGLEMLAGIYLGRWVASGHGLIREIPERDIEFEFPDRHYAQSFATACAEVPGVRVLCVAPQEAV